jgi:NAD(P)-dependent dehydrogenase (short-subunit alcohol dehydrogenase family)
MARVAIVTGGGSGIGQALSAALVQRGDAVVVADVNGEAAATTAGRLDVAGPGTASAATVDVRDAVAVAALVDGIVERHGRLDLMFNNAGIGIGGPVEELAAAHWDRIIDVNLRGVVHGVQAAYPVMVRQGFGHIVNTASLAGLTPNPGTVPYATTKWGVVGLSLSLRAEGAVKGVRVSVVCPGGVDTPILDAGIPADLPAVPSTEGVDARALITKLSGGRLLRPEALAAQVMRGVDRNRAVIIAPPQAHVLWWFVRLSPALAVRAAQSMFARARADMLAPATDHLGSADTDRAGTER